MNENQGAKASAPQLYSARREETEKQKREIVQLKLYVWISMWVKRRTAMTVWMYCEQLRLWSRLCREEEAKWIKDTLIPDRWIRENEWERL